MPQEIDFSKAIENLKDMLSSDEGESQIQNILGMISGAQDSLEENKTAKEGFLGDVLEKGPEILSGVSDIENILKIKDILGAVGNQKNDSSAAFLYALKPFLSETRQAKLENAAKILNMTKMLKRLKDLGLGGV